MAALSAPRARAGALALAAALLALPAAAGAGEELYRCRDPGGAPVYTSDPARCAEAEPYEPESELQRMPGAAAPEAERAPPAEAAPEALRRSRWRRRRERAEAELAALRERLPELRRGVRACARGDELFTEDELGLRRDVPCEAVRTRLRKAERRLEELRHYLEEGLAEECRRAGCLPGWVRPEG